MALDAQSTIYGHMENAPRSATSACFNLPFVSIPDFHRINAIAALVHSRQILISEEFIRKNLVKMGMACATFFPSRKIFDFFGSL